MCVKFSVSFKEGNNVELYIYGTVVNNVSLILYISIIKLTDNKNNQIIILIYNINDTLFTTVP
jgi:hypothetical protein